MKMSDLKVLDTVDNIADVTDKDMVTVDIADAFQVTHKKLLRYTIGVAAVTATFWGLAVYFAVRK